MTATPVNTPGKSAPATARSLWVYIFGVLAAIILLLGLYNLALLLLERLDQPPKPEPGQLLYVSTFDAYNQQWGLFQGQMQAEIKDAALQVTIGAAGDGAFAPLDRAFSDFDVEVDAKWLAVPDEFPFYAIALVFRYQNPDNFYAFQLINDGAYRVIMTKDGVVEPISEAQISPAAQVGAGAVNRMRVVGKDDSFQFYLNGQQLPLCLKGSDRKSTWRGRRSGECISDGGQTRTQFTDASFANGKIGLGARNDSDIPGVQVAFDNVLIYGPK